MQLPRPQPPAAPPGPGQALPRTSCRQAALCPRAAGGVPDGAGVAILSGLGLHGTPAVPRTGRLSRSLDAGKGTRTPTSTG